MVFGQMGYAIKEQNRKSEIPDRASLVRETYFVRIISLLNGQEGITFTEIQRRAKPDLVACPGNVLCTGFPKRFLKALEQSGRAIQDL